MLPLQSFTDYIRENSLFSPDHKILLAVSGGKDSILMAHLFNDAGIRFGIAHCNFGLRGAESQRDEHFVHTLAAVMQVPFHVTHFNTKAYAAEHKISTQMAARDLRYRWFEEIRIEHQYDRVAVAHHQDDAIETVLLNLIRGTGIAGLHGILPKRGHLIRPLLFLSRKAINELIDLQQLDFVEDSSNLGNTYARNKIRLDVIPQLKEINPNLEHTFEQNIQRFTETEMVLQGVVAGLRSSLCTTTQAGINIPLADILTLHPQKLLLFELLRPYNFTEAVMEDLLTSLDKQSGTSFYSHTHRMTINREQLLISPLVRATAHKNRIIHRGDQQLQLDHQTITISYPEAVYFEREASMAFVDEAELIFPMVLREWQDGDRFMPLGMKNYKNLSDFFIDQKIPLPQKAEIPILINGNGEVVWIVGLRQDNRYKVTATTKKVVIFEQKFN
jgi:tRNA(Ile)-lysidine synthase